MTSRLTCIEPDPLTTQDAALRAEADNLLKETGLLDLLRQHGAVHVSGSHSLRLMTWRDLDVYLETPAITVTEFFTLGTRIAESLDPVKMSFANNRARWDPKGPAGLYWGIRLGDIRKGAWKIDLWAMDTPTCRRTLETCDEIAARLTPESRHTILELKSQLWRHPEYRDTITAKTIYDAVLDGGVTRLDGFWALVRSRSSSPSPGGRGMG